VACLRIQREALGARQWALSFSIDGNELIAPDGESTTLVRTGEKWEVEEWPKTYKSPTQYGPFKSAFTNRFVLVVGTNGSATENAWALSKARYDAGTFWYRGNGAPAVVTDAEYVALGATTFASRNVVLYGNRDTNRAWAMLLAKSPIQVYRDRVEAGGRTMRGGDIGALFVRPSGSGLVAAVAPTGIAAGRMLERSPYFVSGASFPDWMILRADSLLRGNAGIVGAGFFGFDWSINGGAFAWQSAD
jgi:hypothetical protein